VPDFESSAMENWGIVMYRESSLLNFEKTKIKKREIIQLISHEIAHQWFGNLVTLEWWNDLWLNEGFASWIEYLGMDHSHPEWRSLDFFKVETNMAMEVDSFETSHPISVHVNDPSEIGSLFDLISYFKGANIIRMMNAFLTESSFKEAIKSYLKTYQFKTANQNNLWTELTRQGHADNRLEANMTVKDIMDTWTLQKGYPVSV
jgi:aminopeptidase N